MSDDSNNLGARTTPTTSSPASPERAELEAVLASGIFSRAPSLALFLKYICDRQLSGEGHLIKEYNIAVEALGRGADFDQKRDSIVRVEAHRLRKRLRQYYGAEGANHPVQIDLPSGGYTPVFLRRETQEPPVTEPPAIEEPDAPTPGRIGWSWRRWTALTGALLSLAALLFWTVWPRTKRETTPTPNVANDPAQTGAASLSEVRIRCGSSMPFTDPRGSVWGADRYFEGGQAVSTQSPDVSGTLSPAIFQSWRLGTFRYKLPMKPGVYELSLYFAEPGASSSESGEGSDNTRTFDIFINGKNVQPAFDIVTEAGGARIATVKTYRDIQPDSEGNVLLGINAGVREGLLNGIEITPGIAGSLRPIRIAMRDTPYTDSTGRLWTEDRHFAGGRLVRRVEQIRETTDQELYRSERYGRVTYSIPVPADSTYTVAMYFAETWFGIPGPNRGGGPGSRAFDILCNGKLLEQSMDPIAQAGGPLLPVVRVFRGLKPAENGRLRLDLIPSKNYAFLNALEVLDERGPLSQPAFAPPVRKK
jgi:hypothetical protein